MEENHKRRVWRGRRELEIKFGERFLHVRVWKAIGKQWDFFKTKISFAVGSGSKVKF